MASSTGYQDCFIIFMPNRKGIYGDGFLEFHPCACVQSGLECFPRGHEASFPLLSILRFSVINFPTLPPSLLTRDSPDCLVCLHYASIPLCSPSLYLVSKRAPAFCLIFLSVQILSPLQIFFRFAICNSRRRD